MKKGFTLVELLVVVSFIVILTTGAYLYLFTQGRGQRDLENTATKIVSLLREANSRATTQSENVDWGMRFEMGPDDRGRYILYADTFTSANYREFVTMPPTLRFVTSTFNVGDTLDVVFDKVTGEASEEAFIFLALANDSSTSVAIRVRQTGLVTLYDGSNQNVATGGTATQSSVYSPATPDRGIDGDTNGNWSGNSVFHTLQSPVPTWWEVDLGERYPINQVNIWNRTDCCPDRIENYYVIVSDTPNPITTTPDIWINHQPDDAGTPTTINVNHPGRYVRVIFDAAHTPQWLHLAEIEVMSPQ